jgi:OmpA-OmpF porin, OOP family
VKPTKAILASAIPAALGLLLASRAAASEPATEDPVYVSTSFGYAWPDRARGADSGMAFKLQLGWQMARHWNLELDSSFTNFETGDDLGSDWYRSSLGVQLLWIPRRNAWTPFLAVGVGAAYNDVYPDPDDQIDPTANAAAGLLSKPLGPYGLRVRLEGRFTQDWRKPADVGDVSAYLGVHIPLRRPKEVVRIEVRETIREVVREVPREIVRETIIQPAVVVDTDRDGIDDSRDRCPSTLPGTRVDSDGCAIEQAVITLQGVFFQTNSDKLTSDSLNTLVMAAAALAGQPTMKVEIRGHTDSVGNDANNLALSQRRAQSVANFLTENSVNASRLTVVGMGETRPVADNNTPEGRATNRRVEFRVLSR